MSAPHPTPEPLYVDHATGDDTGLVMPAHGEALARGGAAWLTDAFRRFGAIGPDQAVARIERLERCPGGSTGAKYFLDVAWEQPDPALHTALFVKFSRDFADRRRDHPGRYEMAAEAPFLAYTRAHGFPVRTAAPYFADYEYATGTGLVVTERVAFGEGGIEPHRPKTLDPETLPDPLPYYRATTGALAALAGAHKAGRLPPALDARFPWDPVAGSADRIRADAAGLEALLADCRAFTQGCPQHFPERVRTEAFWESFARGVRLVRDKEEALQRFLTGDADLVALNHWNAHVDNAFFWREAEAEGRGGALRCGLIDWGRVGPITMGSALWGGLSAAHPAIWDEHLDHLLSRFVAAYADAGGPAVPAAVLERHLVLHVATMGVARVLAFPEIVRFRFPCVAEVAPRDPALLAIEPARNCLHVYAVFLKLWHDRGITARIERFG